MDTVPFIMKPRFPAKDSHSTFIFSSKDFAKNSLEIENALSMVSRGKAFDK